MRNGCATHPVQKAGSRTTVCSSTRLRGRGSGRGVCQNVRRGRPAPGTFVIAAAHFVRFTLCAELERLNAERRHATPGPWYATREFVRPPADLIAATGGGEAGECS